MNDAAQVGLLADVPIDFASNRLVIVVAPGNSLNIRSFTDLNRPGVAVVACAPLVPCGSATQRIEDSTGVQLHLIGEECSVTDVLAKVMNGQADAGLVYVTDTLAAGNAVRMVQFAQSSGAVNTCSIAVLGFVSPNASSATSRQWRSAEFSPPPLDQLQAPAVDPSTLDAQKVTDLMKKAGLL